MNIGIYCIRNTSNDKRYIGSSRDIKNRWRVHKYRLTHNIHHSPHLQNSFNVDPTTFSYELLEKVDDLSKLEIREQHWVDHYQSYKSEFGYNAVRTVSSIDPARMRERWAKPGEKEKQSKIMNPINKGSERRKKVSDGLKKHFSDPKNKKAKQLVCPHRKRVKCIETGQVFDSIAEASRVLSVSVVKIRDSFNYKRLSIGLSFELVKNE